MPDPTATDRAQARAWLAALKWNTMPPGAPTPPIRVQIGEDIVEDLARTLAAARLEGVRAGLEAAASAVDDTAGDLRECDSMAAMIRALDPSSVLNESADHV